MADSFAAQLGNISNQAFIDLLLTNTLDEAPEASETAYWSGFLAASGDRGEVLLAIAESPEHQTALLELPRPAADPGPFA
ncbi:DUF4214 domain-containing protein [Muricoccus aerilatus]|uniref:DUF4214 domain-containing protein n=1 Tax=Muricoccus aerilatus TaxID=452982 RepID=UPI0005C22335|nr:DUF4214 domain-containing protein [Roseomonas aerilata]